MFPSRPLVPAAAVLLVLPAGLLADSWLIETQKDWKAATQDSEKVKIEKGFGRFAADLQHPDDRNETLFRIAR